MYIGACNNYYVILKNKNYLFFQEYFRAQNVQFRQAVYVEV